MNGGFVGCNIVKHTLDKFKNKQVMRTFNFNFDINATDAVLKSRNIENIILVGKNVCHNRKNTLSGIWNDEKDILYKYHAKEDKRQHDMLACREGLIMLGLLDEKPYLEYKFVYPYNNGLKGEYDRVGKHIWQFAVQECFGCNRLEIICITKKTKVYKGMHQYKKPVGNHGIFVLSFRFFDSLSIIYTDTNHMRGDQNGRNRQ